MGSKRKNGMLWFILYKVILAAVSGGKGRPRGGRSRGWGPEGKEAWTRAEAEMQKGGGLTHCVYGVKSSGLASELDSNRRKFSLSSFLLMLTA